MATISIRWYYEASIERWEKLEAKGKLGVNQAKYLAFWRKAKEKYPNLQSIEVSGGECSIGKTGT